MLLGSKRAKTGTPCSHRSPVCPSEPLPHIETLLASRKSQQGCRLKSGQVRRSTGSSAPASKNRVHVTLMPKKGRWLWVAVSASLPLDVRLTTVKVLASTVWLSCTCLPLLLRSNGQPSLPRCLRSGSLPGRCQISETKASSQWPSALATRGGGRGAESRLVDTPLHTAPSSPLPR